MLKGFDRVNIYNKFKLDTKHRRRGIKSKMKGNRFKTDIGKYKFTNRIAEPWNKLPASMIKSNNINTFKNRLDIFRNNSEIL